MQPEMQSSWIGVVAALAAGMAVAGVWYGKVFVDLWWRLTGITPAQSEDARRRNMVQLTVANAVTALGLAAAIAVAAQATGTESVWLALAVGFVAWLAFSATTLLQHNAFELKHPRLTVLNCAYQLVLLLAMSLAIGIAQ